MNLTHEGRALVNKLGMHAVQRLHVKLLVAFGRDEAHRWARYCFGDCPSVECFGFR